MEETKEVVMEEELTSGDSMPLSSSMIRDVFVWILVSWVTQHERTHISQDGPNKTKLMFVEHLSMKFFFIEYGLLRTHASIYSNHSSQNNGF